MLSHQWKRIDAQRIKKERKFFWGYHVFKAWLRLKEGCFRESIWRADEKSSHL